VALNQKVKNLIQKLGEAIHESVSESEDIAGVVKNIREQGFDVLLMLEATIGLNEVTEDSAEPVETVEEGPFTSHDLNFLKSLRISLPEESGPQAPCCASLAVVQIHLSSYRDLSLCRLIQPVGKSPIQGLLQHSPALLRL